MAREAGLSIRGHYDETGSTPSELERFAALVAAAEREASAKTVETESCGGSAFNSAAQYMAKAIRARGEKGQS